MGKKTEKREAEAKQREQEAKARTAEANAEKARQPLRDKIARRRATVKSRNFQNDEDFVNNNSVAAKRNQQIANNANLTATGVGGLAQRYADPSQVAIAQKYMSDMQSQNAGQMFDQDVRNFIGDTNAMENQLAGDETNYYGQLSRDAMGYAWQNQQLAAQIAMQQASWLPQAIGLGIQGFGAVAGAAGWGTPRTGGR